MRQSLFVCLIAIVSSYSEVERAFADGDPTHVCEDGPCASPAAGQALLQSNHVFASRTEAYSEAIVRLPGTSKPHAPAIYENAAALGSDRNKSTFFYHIHVPRTGGSTLANLVLADICNPSDDDIALNWWEDLCQKACPRGLADNEFACFPGRMEVEHGPYEANLRRAEKLRAETEAEKLVFVTTLRRGSDRVLSQWSHEVKAGLFVPPDGVPKISNESLELYISGGPNRGKGWFGKSSPSQRNNLQVAQLASIRPDSTDEVTRNHLEAAKKVLLSGSWLIGFTACMDQVHDKLMAYGESLHGSVKRKVMKKKEARSYSSSAEGLTLSEATSSMLDAYCQFDNELFDWAWALSGKDQRFAATC